MGRSAVKKARIVTQLTLILACALLLTMALTLAMLVRTRNRQRQADHDFFQIKIEEKTAHVSGQLKTLNVVSAQLCQNKLIQAFLTETDTLERWRYKQYVEYLLNILRSNNSQITSTALFDLRGEDYFVAEMSLEFSQALQACYNLKTPENRETVFALLSLGNRRSYTQYAYFTPVYSVRTGEKLGTLVFSGPCSRLMDNETDDYVRSFLTDASGRCYPAAMPEDAIQEGLLYGAEAGFVQTRPYVDGTEQSILSIALIMAAFVALVLALTGATLMRRLTRPLTTLARELEQVKQGRQGAVKISRGGAELTSLSEEINTMLRTIAQRNQENIQVQEQLYQADLARVEAQLYALRSQINPHFLYNTLQTMRGIAMYHGQRDLARIASNTAFIFRYTIQDDPLAQAREEMEIAHRYIEIMNARQTGRFHYAESLAPEVEEERVPRMIVQPLIENAVKHAFENAEHPEIRVTWQREERFMRIIVADNGCGMGPEELRRLNDSLNSASLLQGKTEEAGVGLPNIHKRLRLRYGEKWGVRIESAPGQGTRVVLELPLQKYALTSEQEKEKQSHA